MAAFTTRATSFILAIFFAAPILFGCKLSAIADAPVKDANGFIAHTIECEYQKGKTEIRVLQPDMMEKGVRYPVVYILPVETKSESHFGDGLLEVKKQDLHNKYKAIFVAPTFSHLPWYADHPTDPSIRQETYFLKVVVPFVDKNYPTLAETGGRHLLGFSKSGWGAWSLLLRHPDDFGKAAAWDAPMMMERPGYGMGEVVGSQENFEKYRITKLVEDRAANLGKEKRLILLGMGNFRNHHEKMHALLEAKKAPHVYTDGPNRKHDWHSGWVAEAAAARLGAPEKER